MQNSLNNLIQYIINEAHNEAHMLLNEALENARIERSKVNGKFDEMFLHHKEQIEKQSQLRKQNAIRQHSEKLSKEKTRFALKLIDQLFLEAETVLCEMSSDSFFKFFQNSIANLQLTGEYKVILGQITAQKLSSDERKRLEFKTDNYSILITNKTIPNQGGFILEQFPIEFSFLFKDMLSEIKKKESPALLKQFIG